MIQEGKIYHRMLPRCFMLQSHKMRARGGCEATKLSRQGGVQKSGLQRLQGHCEYRTNGGKKQILAIMRKWYSMKYCILDSEVECMGMVVVVVLLLSMGFPESQIARME